MGFDNECIISIQSLPGEYFCPVCRLLVYPSEALQSQCTHLYCKPCLNYTVSTTRACPYDGYLVTEADSKPLTESNKVLSETIGKIAVHCLYHRSGCTWQGPLSDCTSHCSGCAFGNSPVVCNRCGIQIVHRQVQEHAQNCPGVQSQAQQGEGVQEAAATAATQGTDQTQAATQVGTNASQAQTSQTTVVATPGQDPNQQANPNPQAQTAVPTPEQWYQQQQQYQQYYQQYPGYDPYQQQYQQYYAVQQYQQQPAPVPGQHTAQPYMQPQPQVQPQPQAQAQVQTQAQTQPQPQTQAQHQLHPHGQAPAAAPHQNQQVNLQQQAHPAVHPHSQPQLYPQVLPHPQSQPMQPHPQSYPMQPHPQQPLPMPHYQQPHSQTQQAQPNLQHHPLPQSTPHPQAPPQVQIQHLPQQPQLHPSQPNQPSHPNAQSQATHQSAHAVSGHQSYPHSQPLQQMQLGALQQPSTVMHPQSGPHQQVQNPVQVQAQFLQQPAQMRPPQSQTPMLNQQPPVLLPNPGPVPTIPTPQQQQQQVHPHAHQAGNPGNQRPAIQLNQPPMPQQYVQQQQQQFPFPAQQASSVHSHLNQQGVFVQQQQQLPMQSQLRPQAPSSLPQHSSAYPQLHSNAGFPHGTQPYQSQNQVGRPMLPNQGVQSQPPGGLVGASQVRTMQLGANQQSLTQNYPIRSSNQGQSSTEQQLGHMHQLSHLPSGRDQLSEKDVGGRENDTNNLVIASGSGDDSVDIKTVMSDNGRKPSNNEDLDEHENKADQGSARAGEIPESIRMLGKDSELNALEKKGPVVKQVIKEEPIDGTLEPSAGGKSVGNVGEDQKTVFNSVPKQVKDSSEDKETQERAENLEEQSRKLDKDPLDDGRIVQLSTGVDKGLQAVPAAASTGPDSSAQTTETNLPRGSGVDESRGFPPPDQFHGRGFTHPSNSAPVTDQGSHQPPPSHYGHSSLSQRPSAPAMLHAMPPFGPPHHGQVPGPPPTQLRPQGPGHMAQAGHPLNQADHFQSPGAIPGQGPTLPFGRGPSHLGPPQRSFELQSVGPQGHYNQGPLASSHAGAPRTSQGESVGGPSLGALPPGSFDPHGRAHPHGPDGQMGQQRPNPLDVEMFPNQRHGYFDGRQPDLHHPGSGVPSSMMRMNGPPGLDSSFPPGMRDDRFRHLPEERLNPFPMESGRRIIDRGEFEDDLKQFPRPSHLDSEPVPKFGGYISSSRPVDRGQNSLDKPPHGFNYDTGVKFDPSGIMRPHDAGERSRPGGFHEDNMGRPDFSHTRPDFLGPVPRYGRHHMNGIGEYPGIPPRGFGGQSSLDIDGRFGEGSKPFNLHSEPIGPFHESRFFPPHLRRGEHDGPVNLRINERIDQDILPSHLRRDDHLGPRNSHLRLGEPAGFGPFSGHGRAGELAGPGNFPPRFGEPGFRSSYTLQDSGFYMDNMESFDNPRKRRPATMGWCRICKVDCETVEGLDLHSQTREHQKMAMDIVLNIKQQNAKKRKLTSNDHSSAEDASKSKSATIEGRRNKH